jgi:hypothetical protein
MSKVYVIHENSVWVEPLRSAFGELGTPFEEWFLDQGVLDLRSPPTTGCVLQPHERVLAYP